MFTQTFQPKSPISGNIFRCRECTFPMRDLFPAFRGMGKGGSHMPLLNIWGSSALSSNSSITPSEENQKSYIFWDPRGCSPPGSSVYGIFLAEIPKWVAMWPSGTFIQLFPNNFLELLYWLGHIECISMPPLTALSTAWSTF